MHKAQKNFGDNYQTQVGATDVTEVELQKYELEDALNLDLKVPLLWWKEHEVLSIYKTFLPICI